MSLKGTLTNEELNKRFDNPFALVTYAIRLARNKIAQGFDMEENAAVYILEEIADHRDHLESSSET